MCLDAMRVFDKFVTPAPACRHDAARHWLLPANDPLNLGMMGIHGERGSITPFRKPIS